MGDLVSIGDAAKILKVSTATLRKWENDGRVSSERAPSGHRRFDISKLRQDLINNPIKHGSAKKLVPPVNNDVDVKSEHQKNVLNLKVYCLCCGTELNSINSLRSYSPLYAHNKITVGINKIYKSVMPHCKDCIKREYLEMEKVISENACVTFIAARYDLPLPSGSVTKLRTSSLQTWLDFCEKHCQKFGETKFTQSDMNRIQGEMAESTKVDREVYQFNGAQEAREKWKEEKLSHKDWRKLEEYEVSFLIEYPGIGEEQKVILRDICWCLLKADKATREEDAFKAKQWRDQASAFLSMIIRNYDIAKHIRAADELVLDDKREQYMGCAAARAEWGDPELSKDDWERLEVLKAEQVADRPALSTGGLAAVREYCKNMLKSEQARRADRASDAKTYLEMAIKCLDSESLLKKQASAVELDRLSGMVQYIEGIIGSIPTVKDLLTWAFEELPELHGYNITADAADLIIEDLHNHYDINDSKEPMSVFRHHLRVVDRLNEFVPKEKQSQTEKNVLKLLREYNRTGSFDGADFSILARDE